METLNETKVKIREEGRIFLEQLLKKLVPYAEEVSVDYTVGERTTIYKVNCTQRNIGHIIGSRGRTIESLRVIVNALNSREGVRSVIEIPFFKT